MKLKIKTQPRELFRAGFTLAEVLAALAFMAIVIPVAVRGLQIASRAGVIAQRKSIAARVGERVINEVVVARQWNQGTQSGSAKSRAVRVPVDVAHNQPWNQLSTTQGTTSTTGINQSIVTANNIHELFRWTWCFRPKPGLLSRCI